MITLLFSNGQLAGPEIAEMVRSFRCDGDEDTEIPHHHEDTDAFKKQFREGVKSLCDVMRELGNLFTDTEGELFHIISKTVMPKESVDSVRNRRKPVQRLRLGTNH